MKKIIAGLTMLTLAACGDSNVRGVVGDNGGGGGGGGTADAGNGNGGQTDSGQQVGVDTGQPAGMDAGLSGQRAVDCPASVSWLMQLNGRVVDSNGGGLAAKAQVCLRVAPNDNLVCLRPGDSDAQGNFSIEIPEISRCVSEATMRILVPETNRATMYCHSDLPSGHQDVTIPDPLVLFDTTPASNLPPPGDMSTSRRVAFANGIEIDIVPFDFFSDYDQLAAATIDPASAGLCFLPQGTQLESLYTFSPEGATTPGGFPFSVPNTSGLPAGTRVNFHLLGGLGCQTPTGTEIAEAEWATIGGGIVSQDGQRIQPDQGVGLTCTTWLGVSRQ